MKYYCDDQYFCVFVCVKGMHTLRYTHSQVMRKLSYLKSEIY